MAVTSEEARVRGLPTEAQPAAPQPSQRRATAMQDAIGAELLGLLEQAVPGADMELIRAAGGNLAAIRGVF